LKSQVLIFRRCAARLAFLSCLWISFSQGQSRRSVLVGGAQSPGNAFPPLYTTLSLKNTGITHPVVIDVVSGEIRPVTWKQGTTDTLELLP